MLFPFNRQTSGVTERSCPPDEGLLVVPRRGQWAMMVSLIFFVGPVSQAIDEESGVRPALSLALAVAFVAAYWRTMVGAWVIEDRAVDDERHARALVLTLAALAIAL